MRATLEIGMPKRRKKNRTSAIWSPVSPVAPLETQRVGQLTAGLFSAFDLFWSGITPGAPFFLSPQRNTHLPQKIRRPGFPAGRREALSHSQRRRSMVPPMFSNLRQPHPRVDPLRIELNRPPIFFRRLVVIPRR